MLRIEILIPISFDESQESVHREVGSKGHQIKTPHPYTPSGLLPTETNQPPHNHFRMIKMKTPSRMFAHFKGRMCC